MRWRGGRRSNNVEDRRSMSGPSRSIGGGALLRFLPLLIGTRGGRTLLIFLVIGYFGARMMGIDILALLTNSAPSTVITRELTEQDKEMGEFVSVVLADTEDTWSTLFSAMNRKYKNPTLVLFRGTVSSACGQAQATIGPFYCPADYKLYIDLSFYNDLKTKLGAPGDFAQAYVIAHEVGHHVQTLLGISQQVSQAQAQVNKSAANRLSVLLELQADCFAGIWAHYAHNERQLLEEGDIEEALTAAAAIGDDALQRKAGGAVRPETFTHGTSAQRAEWFKRGMLQGSINECDTFK